MLRNRLVLLTVLLVASLLLSYCAGQPAAPPAAPTETLPAPAVALTPTTPVAAPATAAPAALLRYKVGLVTDGGAVDDGSLNQGAYQGLLRAAEEFDIDVNVIETVQPGDFETNIVTFVNAGYDMVVTVGPVLGEMTRVMAEGYPAATFVAIDATFDSYPDNFVGLVFGEDQMGFLAGALAGLVSERKTVGIVAGMDSPATRQLRDGYENGVGHVCPECVVLTLTLDSPTDPARGRTAALSQIGEGADVIFGVGGATGSGVLLGGAQQGVWVIGVDQDHYLTTFQGGTVAGADRLLSSVVKRVDSAIYSIIGDAMSDIASPGLRLFNTNNNGIGLAPLHEAEDDVSAEIRATLARIYSMLASGELGTGVDRLTGDRAQ